MDAIVRRDVPRRLAAAVFLALALVPALAGDYWTGQLTRYLLFGMLAVSLSLVWGRAGILCFGQAMFFGIGGYVMAALTMGIAGAGWFAHTWPALTIAILAAAAFAAILGAFLFRGGGISGAYLAAVTLALAVIVEQAVRSAYVLGADNGLVGVPGLGIGSGLRNPVPGYYFVLSVAAAVYFGLDALLATRFGVLLTAVRSNPVRLGFLGYSVGAIRVAVFVLGGAIAGLAGALFVATDAFASPSLIGLALSAQALIWVALGGRSVLLAAFLAAVAVRLAEGWLSQALGQWWLLALGLAFMVSVAALPGGLLGTPLVRFGAFLRR